MHAREFGSYCRMDLHSMYVNISSFCYFALSNFCLKVKCAESSHSPLIFAFNFNIAYIKNLLYTLKVTQFVFTGWKFE